MATADLQAKPNPAVLGLLEDAMGGVVRCFRSALSNRASRSVPARLLGVRTAVFEDVVDPLRSTNTVAGLVELGGRTGERGCIVLQGSLVNGMLGMFLGEDMLAAAVNDEVRPLTRFDMRIAERLTSDLVGAFGEGCSMPALQMSLRKVAAMGMTASLLPPSKLTMVIEIELGDPEVPMGLAVILLPAELAQRLISVPRRHAADSRATSADRVLPVSLEVVAELARVRMSIADLERLTSGAVVDLGPAPRVEVRVGDSLALMGEPGEADGRRCVRIGARV